jgi:hypothetical protein
MTPVMKITETLVVLFLVLFCYLFLDKFLFRGELARFASGRRAGRWRVGIGGKPTVSTRRAAAGVGRRPLP